MAELQHSTASDVLRGCNRCQHVSKMRLTVWFCSLSSNNHTPHYTHNPLPLSRLFRIGPTPLPYLGRFFAAAVHLASLPLPSIGTGMYRQPTLQIAQPTLRLNHMPFETITGGYANNIP